ncbi:hypothetical protein NQ315_011653 [Exocentrus adspersus]|uniref:Uncharacterized protein n=1 Tax=Exocentrus adspersus TaxID=1586481 RepID=A0AAV8VBI8_9CUCU|nr:hypothetical protein NQ315_011653 [Exocentrus adspersus]
MSGIIISHTKRQVVNELHKAARKHFRKRRTIIKGFADLWQIDLAEMQQFASCNRVKKTATWGEMEQNIVIILVL